MVFDLPSYRVGRIFGIPIEANASWALIYGLVVFTLATTYFPGVASTAIGSTGARDFPWWGYYALGLLTGSAFFASIVLHEVAHSAVTRSRGSRVDRITLFLFGGVAQVDDEPRTAADEFLMAVAGPVTSAVIGGALLGMYAVLEAATAAWWITTPVAYLAYMNLFVAAFNLLPGFPLDGGRILRAGVWALTRDILRATRVAARVGQFIGWTMTATAVLSVLRGSSNLIWMGLIGWFIASLAGQSYQQQLIRTRLAAFSVASIMSPNPEVVDADVPVAALVDEHFLSRRHSRFPVMLDGTIVGLVTLHHIKATDRTRWGELRAIDVAERDMSLLRVDVTEPASSLLGRLAADHPGALLVVKEGRLAGIVTRADLLGLMQRVGRE